MFESFADGIKEGWTVVEFHGDGDPFFGGSASDRPLGVDGSFLTGSYNYRTAVARFPSKEAAELAASNAPNRRPAGKVGVWLSKAD